MSEFKKKDLLTASEVARYVYCQRAWWYDHKIRIRRRENRLLGVIPRPWLLSISIGLLGALAVLLVVWGINLK